MNITNIVQDYESSAEEWLDWKWQQRNAIRSIDGLLAAFPRLRRDFSAAILRNNRTRRVQITPYCLSLIRRSSDGLAPVDDDPIWRQVAPCWETEGEIAYGYNGQTENWELPSEMITPIAQHKYDNRVIIRVANVCHAYCQFCFEALRTLERHSSKESLQQEYWEKTLDYLRENNEVEEVILSGGEPLIHEDEKIDRLLFDLRNLGRELIIRVHTRALTFNPFRVTDVLVKLLRRWRVSAVGIHVTHPNEITPDFRAAVERLREGIPIMFANIPLLRNVNDTVETMRCLCMTLYSIGVIPHYLYHFMPFSPGAKQFRTPIRTGIDLLRALKRHISNIAVPEFVVPHESGKFTVPLLAEDELPPTMMTDNQGHAMLRFTNWRGEIVNYYDTTE